LKNKRQKERSKKAEIEENYGENYIHSRRNKSILANQIFKAKNPEYQSTLIQQQNRVTQLQYFHQQMQQNGMISTQFLRPNTSLNPTKIEENLAPQNQSVDSDDSEEQSDSDLSEEEISNDEEDFSFLRDEEDAENDENEIDLQKNEIFSFKKPDNIEKHASYNLISQTHNLQTHSEAQEHISKPHSDSVNRRQKTGVEDSQLSMHSTLLDNEIPYSTQERKTKTLNANMKDESQSPCHTPYYFLHKPPPNIENERKAAENIEFLQQHLIREQQSHSEHEIHEIHEIDDLSTNELQTRNTGAGNKAEDSGNRNHVCDLQSLQDEMENHGEIIMVNRNDNNAGEEENKTRNELEHGDCEIERIERIERIGEEEDVELLLNRRDSLENIPSANIEQMALNNQNII
jgi:hypothetical protein